jgi:hypothetical protein
MAHFLCVQCGAQFSETSEPPPSCPICDDVRQYVRWSGQEWTTFEELRKTHRNVFMEEGGLTDFGAEFGCGPRCPLTSVSGDALGYWHAKAGHDIDDLAAGRGFGLLCWQSPSVEAATNQSFVAHHR